MHLYVSTILVKNWNNFCNFLFAVPVDKALQNEVYVFLKNEFAPQYIQLLSLTRRRNFFPKRVGIVKGGKVKMTEIPSLKVNPFTLRLYTKTEVSLPI